MTFKFLKKSASFETWNPSKSALYLKLQVLEILNPQDLRFND